MRVCVKIQFAWCSLHKNFHPFQHKRADSKIDLRGKKSISCDSRPSCLLRNNSGQKYPEVFRAMGLSVPPSMSLFFSCSSLFFLYMSLPLPPLLCISLHWSAHVHVYKFVYARLPKCHWQLQIKMGGECAALSPCNAKGVECHKSPFDLSNQARSCCMQTFVIGLGGGGSGLFSPYASLGCSWWSPPKDEGMEKRWKGRGKNREEKEKGHSH